MSTGRGGGVLWRRSGKTFCLHGGVDVAEGVRLVGGRSCLGWSLGSLGLESGKKFSLLLVFPLWS